MTKCLPVRSRRERQLVLINNKHPGLPSDPKTGIPMVSSATSVEK